MGVRGLERLLVSLTLLVMSLAVRQDLSGKVFTFPEETSTTHVKVSSAQANGLLAGTVCLRFFSDLRRPQSLFSLATTSSINGFLLFKPEVAVYELHALDRKATFWGLPDKLNEWNSICGTWDSSTGLGQLWVNGRSSSRKALHRGAPIAPPYSIVLGQEQDAFGGSFDSKQSFVGLVTDVHMWDRVLSPTEIFVYMLESTFMPGNVLNWGNLEYITQGFVVVEERQTVSS